MAPPKRSLANDGLSAPHVKSQAFPSMCSLSDLSSIANELATGFESLLRRLEEKEHIEQELRSQLSKALEKFDSTRSENPSGSAISEWREEIVKQIDHKGDGQPQLRQSFDVAVSKAKEALKRLKTTMPAPEEPRRCPVAHAKLKHEDLEQDFTTQGKPSSLECPFATMVSGTHGIDGLLDPIAAEFHQDKKSAVKSVDSGGPCRVCPIRFLDKHSPEEIAQYFENHKHEIPRSHEICVKRYQRNESSIREMDEKYGNLVSMIQGLGNKHKAYLPAEEEADLDRDQSPDQISNQAVQKWAQKVDIPPTPLDVSKEDEEPRKSHFEKPLRDVRVGESPSRPWGISVPMNQVPTASAIGFDVDGKEASSVHSHPPAVPISSHRSNQADDRHTNHASSTASPHPTIVFNGPVFFGYSAEQTALFLQSLGTTKFSNS